MNIHEYQAKYLLKDYNIPVPRGEIAYTPEDARDTAKSLGGSVWVVKAQIHAGGRGSGHFLNDPHGKGGVRVVDSPEKVLQEAHKMLGQILITKQTGLEGKKVNRLYIEEACNIQHEYYLAFFINRTHASISMIASTEGGMEIEEVATRTPEKILSLQIDSTIGLKPYHIRRVIHTLSLPQHNNITPLLQNLYQAFVKSDASLLEINPLILTQNQQYLPLDAKITIDDNALFRQTSIQAMDDESEKDVIEFLAHKSNLSYVKLNGNIGCMVNGAGLAMATMDIIQLAGGKPANFLDVGGGATREQIITAFKLIRSDNNVKAILINIFGGIMHCDVVAEAVLSAAHEINLTLPLVVRLAGTNVDLGQKILNQAQHPIITANTLTEAAQKVVQAVKENK